MIQLKARIKFSYEDYQNLPESETKRYELLGGELVMTPSPTSKHQQVAAELEWQLNQFVRPRKLGLLLDAPLDVILSQEDVVQPDILFISQEHLDIIQEQGIRGAPDLLIEIFSPATAPRATALSSAPSTPATG